MLETRKVYYTWGTKEEVPLIKLIGKWLKKLGFNIGDTMQLIKDKNIIILIKEDKQKSN